MPLPLPTVHPRLLDAMERFYPQTVTIEEKVTGARDEWGSPGEVWVNLPGHVDIPARVVSNGPGTGAGGWSGEIRDQHGDYDVEGLTAALQGYYPDILEMHRLAYRGRRYTIEAVEHDAEEVTTRVRTRKP